MNTICPTISSTRFHRLPLFGLALALLGTGCGSSSTNLVAPTGQKCQISVNGFTGSFGPSGGSGSATIDAARECSWSASSQAPWIVVGSPAEGTGNGTLSYSVQANSAPRARSGALVVNAQQLTVSQAAAPCRFTVAPLSVSVPADGASAAVAVSTTDASCGWTAASESSWINVSSGSAASGDGSVSFTVSPNTGTARTGSLLVAGQSVSVDQSALGATPSPTPAPGPGNPPPAPGPTPGPTSPIQLSGEVSGKKGACPELSFFVQGIAVVTNADTVYVNTVCNKVKNGMKVQVDGTQQAGQPVLAARVTNVE